MLRNLAACLAVLALTASSTLAGPPPIPNNDLGSGPFAPEPPAVAPPDMSVAEDALGIVTQLDIQGMLPGDAVLAQLGDASILYNLQPDGSLVTQVVSENGLKELTLPPLPAGTDTDFVSFITPATLVNDRLGDNPLDKDPTKIADGTLVTWGLIESLGTLGKEGPVPNPAEVQAPGNVQTIAEQIPIANPLESITDLVMIDPEDDLFVGKLQEFTSQVPVSTQVFDSVPEVKTALNSLTLTGLTVDSVLAGLPQATEALGSVDVDSLAANIIGLDMVFKTVDLPINNPKTILDPENLELILVDGGLGKIAAVPGAEKLQFDNNLVTNLKDADSTKLTSFVSVSKIADQKTIGKTLFHPELGGYDDVLKKTDTITKQGFTTFVMPPGVSCKQQLAGDAQVPKFCTTPDAPSIPVKGGDALGAMAKPDLHPKLADSKLASASGLKPAVPPAAGLPGGPALPGEPEVPKVLPIGSGFGILTGLPSPPDPDFLPEGGAVMSFMPAPVDTSAYDLGKWSLPSEGIGALPEVDPLNPDAVPNLACAEDCLPTHELTIADGVYEGFSAPSLPSISPVVPVDAATGVISTVTDLAGNGLTLMPLDMLNKLPLGLTSDVQLRFVGAPKSIFSHRGIPDVSVQVKAQDPLGLSKSTATYTSNTNGYVTVPLPSLGSYTVSAIKEDFEPVTGAGQAPAPGQTAGQEYTMNAATGNTAKDKLANNGASYLVFLLVGVVVFVAIRRYVKKRRGPKAKGGR